MTDRKFQPRNCLPEILNPQSFWLQLLPLVAKSKSYPFCKYLLIIDNSCSIVHHQSTAVRTVGLYYKIDH